MYGWKKFSGEGENKNLDEIQEDEIILDIGINTIEKLKKSMSRIQFYGMVQLDILKILTFRKALYRLQKIFLKIQLTIFNFSAWWGDTLAAINKSSKLSFSHLSTAGGAFLEYLEGKDLPGISVLK